MPIHNRIADFRAEMTAWRQDIHAHPELKYEETRTAALVAEKLRSWGIEVHEGIAKTGLVGVLKGQGKGGGTIGIRADMDALPMEEEGDPAYRSTRANCMHACGHDGHTTMLLGAAKYLAETRNFDGTVNFIFQPAEEGGGGAKMMIEEGLFDRFPCDTVWGMHNAPHMPAGIMAVRAGPMLASADTAFFTIKGRGGHAARPHETIDPVMVGVQLYQGLQTIVSRSVNPRFSAVVSVTNFHAGSATNVIPGHAKLAASVRTFDNEVRDLIEERMAALCKGVGEMFGCKVELDYRRGYPPTINPPETIDLAADVMEEIVGADKVDRDPPPSMGAEDFSYMLEAKPGAYLWIGQGAPGHDIGLHNPFYDFNDEVLPIGASFWAKLVETKLPRG